MTNKMMPPILERKLGVTVSKIIKTIVVVCALVSTLMMFVYVLMRYLFGINFKGFEEIILIFVFWLYYMGGAYGSYENSHIVADITDSFVKAEKIKRVIRLFVDVIKVGVMCFLVYLAVDFVTWNIKVGSHTPVYKLPSYLTQGSLLVGFVLILIFDICYMVYDFQCFFSKKDVAEETGSEGGDAL